MTTRHNAEIAAVEIPSLEGEEYAATVPDTLDLADHAALALNGLGGTIDPEMDYLPFGQVCFAAKEPYMHHWASADVGCVCKFGESFPMMRLMCGSDLYRDREDGARAAMLHRCQDGLYWDLYSPDRPWRNIYGDSAERYGKGQDEDFSNISHTGRMLRAVLMWRELAPDPRWDAVAQSLVDGMRRVAIVKDDYCYYPEKGGWGEACTMPRSGWLDTAEAQDETEGGEGSMTGYHAHQTYAAAHWYMLTGDPTALDLAARLTRYCMQPKFWGGRPNPDPAAHPEGLSGNVAARLPDPPYSAGAELGHWFSHWHARATVLRGMLEYARAVGEERVLEFVRRSYEFTLTQGIPRLGWFNTHPVSADRCEGCALGDNVALGIRLTDAGLGDYWDDVDAMVRNQLVEQQFTRRDQLERIAAASEEYAGYDQFFPRQATRENVIERALGVYAGLSHPYGVYGAWSMLCCTGNATEGLYYAWEGIVRESGDTAQVNLLLNRAAKLLDIDSYLPYEGKVMLRNKAARRIAVRIPVWVSRRELKAEVNGKVSPLDWVGNYLIFDGLQPGQIITVRFPVPESTARYTVNAQSDREQVYTCTFRGSTVVDISPRNDAPAVYPFYLRDHLKATQAPMRDVRRFVARKKITLW